MSGALAERVFAAKIEKAGFVDLRVIERYAFGIQDCESPLFTPDLLDLMRRLLPPDQHGQVATALTVTARKPDALAGEPSPDPGSCGS